MLLTHKLGKAYCFTSFFFLQNLTCHFSCRQLTGFEVKKGICNHNPTDHQSSAKGGARKKRQVRSSSKAAREQLETILREMADAEGGAGDTAAAAAAAAEGSPAPAAPKKNQKPVEPPVTFRDFDVCLIIVVVSLLYTCPWFNYPPLPSDSTYYLMNRS